jgi:hypothetical protein
MYYFDAVLLKERFKHGDSAEYIFSPALGAITFDARFGWLAPDEIIEKLGSLFAAKGILLYRLSDAAFVAAPTNDVVIESTAREP